MNWEFVQHQVALVQQDGLFDIPAVRVSEIRPVRIPESPKVRFIDVPPVRDPEAPNIQVMVKETKVCGPKQGANRWTKPELELLARQRGINPHQPLDQLCKALRLHLVAVPPIAVPLVAVAPHSSIKVCGPKQGSNRWTKLELEQLARQRGINPHQPLDHLCHALRLTGKPTCTCQAIVASGKKKGQTCGRPCTHGQRCGFHAK